MGYEESYYNILQVSPEATISDIKKAYKLLAKKFHPDMNPKEKQEWAEENFRKINMAYEVLSNPVEREKYDNEADVEFTPYGTDGNSKATAYSDVEYGHTQYKANAYNPRNVQNTQTHKMYKLYIHSVLRDYATIAVRIAKFCVILLIVLYILKSAAAYIFSSPTAPTLFKDMHKWYKFFRDALRNEIRPANNIGVLDNSTNRDIGDLFSQLTHKLFGWLYQENTASDYYRKIESFTQ